MKYWRELSLSNPHALDGLFHLSGFSGPRQLKCMPNIRYDTQSDLFGFLMPPINRTTIVRLALVSVLLLVAWSMLNSGPPKTQAQRIPYSQMLEHIRADQVRSASYDAITGELVAKLGMPSQAVDVPAAPPPVPVDEDDVSTITSDESEVDGVVDPEAATGENEEALVEPSLGESVPAPAVLEAVVSQRSVATTLPPSDNETLKLLAAKATLEVRDRPRPSAWSSWAMALVPIMLFIAFLWWFMRRQSGGQAGHPAMNFGKARVQSLDPSENPVRFADVAGCDEAKGEVVEIVEFLKDPEKYARLGGKMPHGVLLVGPPGTGKTLLAKAIAGEAKVPFFFTSGSDFVEMFVGVGASRVRDMFAQAKAQAPSIIFIDELDAVGGKRSSGGTGSGGHDEREQTLNQLLVEMNGFVGNEGVIVLAATNRADMLDKALTRPGRFDREVMVSLPDRAGRVQILKVHGAKIPTDVSVDWDQLAAGTPGFSGAELANLTNEAALAAARQGARFVTQAHLEWARDRVMMGAEKLGGMKNERERTITAYHEAGHAVVARFLDNTDPVHKITIVPRGRSLGLTMQLPREDSYNLERDDLMSRIAVLMGGRAAEELALNVRTAGAGNDFSRAASMARQMVATWGMDDTIGPISVDGEYGVQPGLDNGWSDSWKRQVDDRVANILRTQYQCALALLKANHAILEEVSQALLEKETLDGVEFEAIVQKHAVA